MRKQSETSQFKMGLSSGSNRTQDNHSNGNDDKENHGSSKRAGTDAAGVKRDFFGRIVHNSESLPASKTSSNARQQGHKRKPSGQDHDRKVWVTFHEGFSNAVRKPVSMAELLADL